MAMDVNDKTGSLWRIETDPTGATEQSCLVTTSKGTQRPEQVETEVIFEVSFWWLMDLDGSFEQRKN